MTSGEPSVLWKTFVDSIMKKRPLLGALLCHANFRMDDSPNGKIVTVAFTQGSFYERQALDQKNRVAIEAQIKAFFGPETMLSLSSAPLDAAGTHTSIEQTKQAENAALKKDALEHPSVIGLKNALGAEVVGIDVEG